MSDLSTDTEVAQLSDSPQLNSGKQKNKPPQPDENTFATQQEFLDSLHPIPIQEIEENDRKCDFCWKPYGEAADPDHDNSEEPVRFRCGHHMGNKCLQQKFGLPGIFEFALRQLTLSSGSRGGALYQQLRTYAARNRQNSRDDTETFTKMLQESLEPGKGPQLFGGFWWFLVKLLQTLEQRYAAYGRYMSRVTILDNAVVMDTRRSRSSPGNVLVQPRTLGSSCINLSMTLPESVTTTPDTTPPRETLPKFAEKDVYNNTSLSEMSTPSNSLPTPLSPTNMQLAPSFKSTHSLQQAAPPETLKPSMAPDSSTTREFISSLAAELARIHNEGSDPDSTTQSKRNGTSYLMPLIIVVCFNTQHTSYETKRPWKILADNFPDKFYQEEDAEKGELIPIIIRVACTNCQPTDKDVATWEIPTSLRWKKQQVADSCPYHNTILFKTDD